MTVLLQSAVHRRFLRQRRKDQGIGGHKYRNCAQENAQAIPSAAPVLFLSLSCGTMQRHFDHPLFLYRYKRTYCYNNVVFYHKKQCFSKQIKFLVDTNISALSFFVKPYFSIFQQ
jgi:hypothetical protein